jgi:MFS family permease
VLLTGFVAWERRSSSPLVDVVVNARPGLLLTNVASSCVGFALFGGLCLLPSGIAMLLLSPVSAALTNRFGPKVTLALGALIVGLGFLARIWLDAHLWEIVVGTSVAGAGTGIAYAAMPSLIGRAAPRTELAAANGLNTLCRSVGSSLASAIGGTLFASQLVIVAGGAFPSHGAYRPLFAMCAGAAVVGAAIALTVPAHHDASDAESREPADGEVPAAQPSPRSTAG